MTERYVTARQLATIMGVSERTIKRMVAAGMPSETWGMSRCRRFLPSRAMTWASDQAPSTIEPVKSPARRANAAMGVNHQEAP